MIVNGEEMHLEGQMTVIQLLQELDLAVDRVVVEINREILPKETFGEHLLDQRDTIEIVGFVGGG